MTIELNDAEVKLLRRALVKLEVFYEDAVKNAEKLGDYGEAKETRAKIRACENLHFKLLCQLETSQLTGN